MAFEMISRLFTQEQICILYIYFFLPVLILVFNLHCHRVCYLSLLMLILLVLVYVHLPTIINWIIGKYTSHGSNPKPIIYQQLLFEQDSKTLSTMIYYVRI